MDVDGAAGLIQLGIAPDLLLNEFTRKDLTGIGNKQRQQLKFGFSGQE